VAEPSATVRGAIFDWGGVITSPILDTVSAWLEADHIDKDSYAAAIRPWIQRAYGALESESPIHALERGEVSDAEFETTLAALLVKTDGGPVQAAGMLKRMFAASVLQAEMLELIRNVRSAGLRTGLLSNSWGTSDGYPRHLFRELFDDVVISAEVGMRKPEDRIFVLASERLGVPPPECVFIDDVDANIAAAKALGFLTVHHSETRLTIAALTGLLAGAA
jgi:putative hydrolase of the HAD superfamily